MEDKCVGVYLHALLSCDADADVCLLDHGHIVGTVPCTIPRSHTSKGAARHDYFACHFLRRPIFTTSKPLSAQTYGQPHQGLSVLLVGTRVVPMERALTRGSLVVTICTIDRFWSGLTRHATTALQIRVYTHTHTGTERKRGESVGGWVGGSMRAPCDSSSMWTGLVYLCHWGVVPA